MCILHSPLGRSYLKRLHIASQVYMYMYLHVCLTHILFCLHYTSFTFINLFYVIYSRFDVWLLNKMENAFPSAGTVTVIWNMCMSPDVRALIVENKELAVIEFLENGKLSKNERIKRKCEAILMLLKDAMITSRSKKNSQMGELFLT